MTNMPHGAIHLFALKDRLPIRVLNKPIICSFLRKPNLQNNDLVLMNYWANTPLILNLNFNRNELAIINKKIVEMENKRSIINFVRYYLRIYSAGHDIAPRLGLLIRLDTYTPGHCLNCHLLCFYTC